MSDEPPRGSTTRILVVTGLLAVAAGLGIAALLLFATGRTGDTPKGPFVLGPAQSLRRDVREGGPVAIADPTGRTQGLYLVLENDRLVAAAVTVPGSKDCNVRWRGSVKAFGDCHGRLLESVNLARYPMSERDGLVYVDTRRTEPPPG